MKVLGFTSEKIPNDNPYYMGPAARYIPICNRSPYFVEPNTLIATLDVMRNNSKETLELMAEGEVEIEYKGKVYKDYNSYSEELRKEMVYCRLNPAQIPDYKVIKGKREFNVYHTVDGILSPIPHPFDTDNFIFTTTTMRELIEMAEKIYGEEIENKKMFIKKEQHGYTY